ncbi:MAG: glycosyltransferase [Planctomycetes bacterium]|nr:glycosyltransferase [Planctomycetota bacterium]
MKQIALCMIVRDEERFLAGCLDSVKGLVDALIVVDTGSSDRTVEIAESRGATVVRHVWADDFAAARNAGLARVPRGRERWVLVLDADERLAPGAAQAIRAAVEQGGFELGLLPLHDASALDAAPSDVVSGRARRGEPVALPRLMRLDEELGYEGRIHEQVTTWASKPGRRTRAIDAPIVHLGAVPELRAERGKSDRNRRLLELRAAEEPSNPIVRAYLARELERALEPERALAEARAAWSALVASARAGAPQHDAVLPATIASYLLIAAGAHDEALSILSNARGWSSEHPNLDLLEGLAHERRALAAPDIEAFATELAAARSGYERCLALAGRTFAAEVLPGACGATGRTRLASVLLLAGETEAARAEFQHALAADPASVEAALGRAECLLDGGQTADALRALEPLLVSGTPDAWTLAAETAFTFDDLATARKLAESARNAAQRTPWIGAWRRGRLTELEQALSTPAGAADVARPGTPAATSTRGEAARPAAARPESARVESASLPSATVVVPCYNRFDLLRPVLEGLAREKRAGPFQLVLVDDGSEPSVDTLVRDLMLEQDCEVVRRPNGGRGAALNDGLARATGEVVIFCDSDIVPCPGFVREHQAFHAEAQSDLATHLGALEWGVDAGLTGWLLGARSNPRLRGGTRRVDWTQWFTDNWSFRRSLFQRLDLRFDLAYRAWGFEELDLARVLESAGATNTLSLRAKGRHLKPATIEGLRANFARSVPNLLHLARKCPNDRTVRDWLGGHASADDVERAERAFDHAWRRLQELDAAHRHIVRDVQAPAVDKASISLSNAVFQLGITRGLAKSADLAAAHADLLPPPNPRSLFTTISEFAQRVEALERRCSVRSNPGGWLTSVARELGWDASSHALRDRWAAPIAAR